MEKVRYPDKAFINAFISLSVFIFFSAVFLAGSASAYVSVFGPKRYIRTTGLPNKYNDTFETTALAGALVIKNGEEDGSHRISSALIHLNGEKIFETSDFSQRVFFIESSIEPGATNELYVELRSTPEGYITIEIVPTIQPPIILTRQLKT